MPRLRAQDLVNQNFDPKINDTVILNNNIKQVLLARYIICSWMERKQISASIEARAPAFSQLERTGVMRGENIGDLDPSLTYDLCGLGHLGYNPELGPPNGEQAVQAQYHGSRDLWIPPNDNPAVADFLADKVIEFIEPQK